MKKVLEIGPSITRAKGGMSKVILDIKESDVLNNEFDIDIYESYIDGNLFERMYFSIKSFLKFKKIYKKYDIFHIHMACYGSTFRKGLYMYFLKRKHKKVILHVHGGKYLEFYNGLSNRKKQKVKNIWQQPDEIIVLSEEWEKIFEEIFEQSNITAIPNGIQTSDYKNARCSYEQGEDNYLFLGRIVKDKGIYDLLAAIKVLTDEGLNPILHIAGDGELDLVKEFIKKNNIEDNVVLHGWCSLDQTLNILKQCDTLILPSYFEAMPICILEAMAAGKVIIATNVGAIEDVVKNKENGLIVEPGNVNQLSVAMKNINENLYNNCYQNNIKLIEEYYDINKMHNKILRIIKEEVK